MIRKCIQIFRFSTASTLCLIFLSMAASGQYTTKVIAGHGARGIGGDGGAAKAAELQVPRGMAVDKQGNVFFVDGERIRVIDARTGRIDRVAGNSNDSFGYNGDSIPADLALLNTPIGLVFDTADNLYIVEQSGSRVRKISSRTGLITTVAGAGRHGYNGDGIPATAAKFNQPSDLAIDARGNLYIVDDANFRIRMVHAATGLITTLAGTGVRGYNGENKPGDSTQLDAYGGIAVYGVDSDGTARYVYFIDGVYGDRLRRIDLHSGIVSAVAGTGVSGYNGENVRADSAQLDADKLAIDSLGNIYLANVDANRIQMISAATGRIRTIAGTGDYNYNFEEGNALLVSIGWPTYVTIDRFGNLYFSDPGNARLRKLTRDRSGVAALEAASVRIYPNPVTDVLTVELDNPEGLELDVSVCDISGRCVKTAKTCSHTEHLDLSDLSPALYFLQISGPGVQIYSRKLIKL